MRLNKLSVFGASLGVVILCAAGAVVTLLPAGVAAEDAPSYKPPMMGAPTRRVGGGTRGLSRGAADTGLRLAALTPESTGLSATDQPILYWAISRQIDKPVEITVNDNDARQTLLETTVQAPAPGIHAFKLADSGKRLKAGVEYEWMVRVALDPKQPSADVVASGTIVYRPLAEQSPDMAAKIKQAQADKVKLANLYAEAGFWYDALANLSAQIAAEPGNENLKAARVALLEQVDMAGAVDFSKQ